MNVADYAAWLDCKEAIDRKSINIRVMRSVKKSLSGLGFIRVLDCGTGTGSLTRILIDRRLMVKGELVAIDKEPQLLVEARSRFRRWAKRRGISLLFRQARDGEVWGAKLTSREIDIDLSFRELDVYELSEVDWPKFDLVAAMSLLDLLNPEKALDALHAVTARSGIIYLLLNYDHATVFEPSPNRDYEEWLLRMYDQTMYKKRIDGWEGDPYVGRRLIHLLADRGFKILGYGPSDWLVFPKAGQYSARERLFLRYIIETVRDALKESGLVETRKCDAWAYTRLKHLEENKLVYICHQTDVAGQLGA